MEFEERYFREELDYLRQLSKLLATEKPHLARFLAEKDADPDIERLLEGVAFLTGNLRQKIEDEFPELTHGLIKMLWPNYLRPVPAMTLIEYSITGWTDKWNLKNAISGKNSITCASLASCWQRK
uniref:type VI secretion system baseplate subunit TssF n=1 Tax=Shigella flexneri TaxID=623 RepID=UPI002094DEF1